MVLLGVTPVLCSWTTASVTGTIFPNTVPITTARNSVFTIYGSTLATSDIVTILKESSTQSCDSPSDIAAGVPLSRLSSSSSWLRVRINAALVGEENRLCIQYRGDGVHYEVGSSVLSGGGYCCWHFFLP